MGNGSHTFRTPTSLWEMQGGRNATIAANICANAGGYAVMVA